MLIWILLWSVTNRGEAKWNVFVVYNEQKSKTKNVSLKAGLLRILHVAKEHLSCQCILSGLCKQLLLLEKTKTRKKICLWYHRLSHPCLCTLLSHGERSITARIGSTKHIIAEPLVACRNRLLWQFLRRDVGFLESHEAFLSGQTPILYHTAVIQSLFQTKFPWVS